MILSLGRERLSRNCSNPEAIEEIMNMTIKIEHVRLGKKIPQIKLKENEQTISYI